MKKALFAVLTALCLMLVSTAAMAETLQDLINQANPGDIVQLTQDVTYSSTLKIEKAITLDLNGYNLTVNTGYAGISAKGGCTITSSSGKGKIIYNGNNAAIKVWQAAEISNLDLEVKQVDDSKTVNGIVVQEGSTNYLETLKNVKITGADTAVETFRCGNSTGNVINLIDGVTIEALDTGMALSARVGTIKNSTISGGNIGVNMYRYGTYSVTADFENCEITGKDAAIWAHDEVFDHPTYNNNGDFELNIDDKTKLTATSGAAPVQEEIAGQGETAIDIEEPKDGLCQYTDANGKVHVFMKHTIEYDKYNRPYKCTVCGKHFQSAYMPETGDASSLFAWLGVLAISCAALTAKSKAYN